MEQREKQGGSFATLGIAALLIAVCVVSLGSFLANAGAAETGTVHAEAISDNVAISDEVTAPAGLNVKVDTRGIDLPEGCVSAQYAIAAAAELAEHAYEQIPTERAQAVLYNSETTTVPSVDTIKGLYWAVTLETDGGMVSITIAAKGGTDIRSDFSSFSADEWKAEFDARAPQAAGGSSFGTEAELIASREAHPTPEPLMDAAQQAEARQRKIDTMNEYAKSVVDKPQSALAVSIVNERNLGNGSQALSGRIVTQGGGGPIDQVPLSTYLVEVTLDDGSYLFLELGTDDMQLHGYRRCPVDWITLNYS